MKKTITPYPLVLSLALLAGAGQSHAQAPAMPAPDPAVAPAVLSLTAEVRKAVEPDLMHVVLAVESAQKDLGAANRKVLVQINEALDGLKPYGPGLTAAIQQVMTSPVYDEKGKPGGWRVRAEMVVQGTDFEKVASTVGRLSTRMELTQLEFVLSPGQRQKVQEDLRTQLGQEFNAKARSTAAALGYRNAQIREVSLQEDGHFGPRPMMAREMALMAADGAPSLPTQAGPTEVVVRMHGSVFLAP